MNARVPEQSIAIATRGSLELLSGVQAGASATLGTGRRMLCGTRDDCDLRLRDPAMPELALAATLRHDTIVLEACDVPLLIEGEPLAPGEVREYALGSLSLTAGALQCRLQVSAFPRDNAASDVPSPADNAPAESDGSIGAAQTAADTATAPESLAGLPDANRPVGDALIPAGRHSLQRRRWQTWLIGGVVLLVASLSAVAVMQRGAGKPSRATVADVRALLPLASFPYLEIAADDDRLSVSGYVAGNDELQSMRRQLAGLSAPVTYDVLVGDKLGEQVAEVFRVNGLESDVQVEPPGAVTVRTSTRDDALLTRLDTVIAADVPGIDVLVIENTPPAPEPAPASTPDPEKRVASVVSGAHPYVITVDQSRYFVGSWLPTGHRIEAISDGQVTLVKDGVESKLQF